MISYVLDASVAAKWVLPAKDEPLSAESVRLLDSFAQGEIGLFVPDLFWPEIGNILWKSARSGRISAQSAIASLSWLQSLRIPTTPSGSVMHDAIAIAFDFDRTVYDALYVAMAVSTGRPLVTADERLVNALGARLPVRWLGAVA